MAVEREMTALRAAHLQQVNSSTKLSAVPFVGTVMLVPSNTANLPKAPERTPKDDTFSGYLAITARRESVWLLTPLGFFSISARLMTLGGKR